MNPNDIKKEIERLEKMAKDKRPFTDLHDARTAFNMVQGNINSALIDLRNVRNKIESIQSQMKDWDFSTLSEDHHTPRRHDTSTGGERWKDLLTDALEQTNSLCDKAKKDAEKLEESLNKCTGPANRVI